MARLWACVLLCAIAGAFLWGCSESARPEPENGPQYPLRTSPDSLLAQLEWAYENESLGVYMDCLADSFRFFLCIEDITNDPTLPEYWFRSDENTIHTNMFSEPGGADRITLTLTTASIETVSVPGERGVEWNYTEEVDLRVHVGTTIYAAGRPSRFTIALDPDDVGPNGETLYEIREWRELDLWKGAAPQSGEESSWGSIKALYR